MDKLSKVIIFNVNSHNPVSVLKWNLKVKVVSAKTTKTEWGWEVSRQF